MNRGSENLNTHHLDTIDIEEMTEKHVARAVKLVLSVFDSLVAPDCSAEGIDEFRSFVNVPSMKARLRDGNIMLVAREGRKLVGVIEIRSKNHISLFFVAPSHQRRGIARALFQRAVALSRSRHKHITQITVNAALKAVVAYKALGFTPISGIMNQNGITYRPMAHTIPPHLGR
ncbi:GNAT family N-acetyltransferase [Myxococcota bacterium]|nr:GNAT family N-acetyltransferase [Myxococcota bacterium]MBU1535147.1 GNAT family N-acetyltransferase [Myxococcota bacterium]